MAACEGRPAAARLRGRLLLALLSGPLFLGAAEVALTLAGWPPPFAGLGLPVTVPYDLLGRGFGAIEPDPETLFRFRPGIPSAGLHPIDSLGLVGPEARAERAPGAVRIVCLGDSCTFGVGEVPGRSYPDLLRAMFARAFGDGRVEVLNAGTPTFTSTQTLRRFRRDLLPLRPDVAVAYFGGHNEFQESPLPDAAVIARLGRPVAKVLRLSRVGRGLRLLATRLFPAPREAGGVRVPLPQFRDDLDSLARECREAGVALALLVPPHSDEERATHPACDAYAKEVSRAASDLGALAVDVPASFAAVAPYPLWREAVHPNLAGYRRIALAVYDSLVASPVAEASFRRAGPDLVALRAFEALAAGAEREEPRKPIWRAVEAALREAPAATPELEKARAIVAVRLRDAPLAREDLARAGFGSESLAVGLVGYLAGGAGVPAGGFPPSAVHTYRPGMAALAEALLASRMGGGEAPPSPPVSPDALRAELGVSDPLNHVLGSLPSPQEIRASASRVGAALLLLLHRDRVIGAPSTVDQRVGKAALALARQDLAGARAFLEAALAANPDEPLAAAQLGLLEDAEGRPERARALLEGAVRADPSYGEAWICLAALALRRGDAGAALACVDACLRARPYLPGALVLRARLRIDRGDREGAGKDLVRVRDLGAWTADAERLWEESGGR